MAKLFSNIKFTFCLGESKKQQVKNENYLQGPNFKVTCKSSTE